MLMNYHELTMDEPRNSKSRKLQFRVICIVMASCIVWALISAGALRPVEVKDGVFPGGEFIYKFTGRDYAASQSLVNDCGKHLGIREIEQGYILYSLYLDDPQQVNGRRQRFASGYLLNDQTVTRKQETNEERKQILREVNSQIQEISQTEMDELSAFELWPKLKYKFVELPSVKAAVVEYKYSGGFVSALVHSYKVFPSIRQYAKEMGAPGNPPTVITTCNVKDNMCTHYVPLEDPGNVFRLGTREYTPEEYGGTVNWEGVKKMALKLVTFGKGGEVKETAPKMEETPIKKAPEPIPNEEGKKQEETVASSETPEKEANEEVASEPEPPVEETPEAEETTISVPDTPVEAETAAEEIRQNEPVAEEFIEAETQNHATEEVPVTHSEPTEENAKAEEVAPATDEEAPENAATTDDPEQENVQQTPDRDEL